MTSVWVLTKCIIFWSWGKHKNIFPSYRTAMLSKTLKLRAWPPFSSPILPLHPSVFGPESSPGLPDYSSLPPVCPCICKEIFLSFLKRKCILFIFGCIGLVSHGILVPWPGIKLTSLVLEGRVLTIRPPGKSLLRGISNTHIWPAPPLLKYLPRLPIALLH